VSDETVAGETRPAAAAPGLAPAGAVCFPREFPRLGSARLVLDAVGPEDAEALYAIFRDEQAMRYWSTTAWPDARPARVLIERAEQGFARGEAVRWAIRVRGAPRLIGTATLYALSTQNRRAELGYAGDGDADELVDGSRLLALQGWREHVESTRRAAARDLDLRDLAVSERQDALTAASREREALERLKVKADARHALAERRADSARTDEIALTAHHRRGRAA